MANVLPNLDDLVGVPIAIDGEICRVLTNDAVSILTAADFQHLYEQYFELGLKAATLSVAERKKAKTLLDAMCALVLLAPDGVRKKLHDHQQVRIIQLFLNPPTLLAGTSETMSQAMGPSTGSTSPADSPGSTEEPPLAG